MGEHGISHYIDMFAKATIPELLMENRGIATISISKIQNFILNKDTPPIIKPTQIPEQEIIQKLGHQMLDTIHDAMKTKIFDEKRQR